MRDTLGPFVTLGDAPKSERVTPRVPRVLVLIAMRDTRDTDTGVDTTRARIGAYVQNRVTQCHVSRRANTTNRRFMDED
jgi:hypothetical protein